MRTPFCAALSPISSAAVSTLPHQDYETAKEKIDVALSLEPSSWEKALAKELQIEIKGLDRRSVRQKLYLDEKKQTKKGGQVSRLRKAMEKLAQTEEFRPYFEALREKLEVGVEVLQWHRSETKILTRCNGNGYYGLKHTSSSVHFSAIQAIYRIMAE